MKEYQGDAYGKDNENSRKLGVLIAAGASQELDQQVKQHVMKHQIQKRAATCM